MRWYEGNIAEAIQKSKIEGAIFGVAIFGEDESSKQLESSLNSENVQKVLDNGKFVVIRITTNSEEHKQFSQIYSNAPSPSIYLIGDKGATLEVVSSNLSPAELEEKFKSAWNRHSSPSVARVDQQSTSPRASVPVASSTSTTGGKGAGAGITKTQQALVNANDAVKQAEEAASQTNLTLEEKIERAQRLAAAKRQQKLAQEAEDERQKERERRDQGKGMAELKRWQDEQEAKKLVEERKKDKIEEQELRRRVKEQIAQDRAARNARSNVSFLNEGPIDPNAPASSTVGSRTVGVTSTAAAKDYTGKARLQFRMPTGSSVSHVFEPDTQLADVRDFLITNNHVTFRQFTLSVAYPRRQFTSSEYTSTLRDLGLVPSAALLVLPVSGSSSVSALGGAGSSLGDWISTIISYLFIPFAYLFSFFPLFASVPAAPPENQPPAAKRSRPTPSASNDPSLSANPGGDSSSPASSDVRNRKGNKGKGRSSKKIEGNIHRLRTTEGDSDDDEGTWNGNSTQQM